MSTYDFTGRVAIITGAGNGLGRSHALALAARGAKVLVNDLGGDTRGEGSASASAADAVVDEIRRAGGEAQPSYANVLDGDSIVAAAMEAFGTVDIVINNAGILRDKSFVKMEDADWQAVLAVHLQGAYSVTRAAWPVLMEKGYGRVLFTTSAAGIYGNFGQANYCAAKLGVHGLSQCLAIEGRKNNIYVNTIAPLAGSRLTKGSMPDALFDQLKVEQVTPLVVYLCSDECRETKGLFEVGAGYVGRMRWERSIGGVFDARSGLTPETIARGWSKVDDFSRADNPAEATDSIKPVLDAINNPPRGGNEFIDLDEAFAGELVLENAYDERDLALYALGIGMARDPNDDSERRFAYELDSEFSAFPSYAVIPQLTAMLAAAKTNSLELPGCRFGFDRLLHGEQLTQLLRPLPREAKLVHSFTVKDVFDKDPNALVIFAVTTRDADTGVELAYNEMTAFIRGAGGWGGDRGPSEPVNEVPSRAPDAVIEDVTDANQTLLYRLSGDWNPLHADPAFAKAFGFDKPILHGMCTFGFGVRHVLKAFADNDPRLFSSVKVRFAKMVYPGETLVTSMWRESDTRIVFEMRVRERDEVVLSNAAVELHAEVPDFSSNALSGSNEPGAAATADRSDKDLGAGAREVVAMLNEYLRRNPELSDGVGKIYQWNIKDPDFDFVLDLKASPGSVQPGVAAHDTALEMLESDLMEMMRGGSDATSMYFAGKLKITGDVLASQKLQFLADMDPEEAAGLLASVSQRADRDLELQTAQSETEGSAEELAGDSSTALRDSSSPLSGPQAEVPDEDEQMRELDELLMEKRGEFVLPQGMSGCLQLSTINSDAHWLLDFSDGSMRVSRLPSEHADTTVRGNPESLLAWLMSRDAAAGLFQRGAIRVDGDMSLFKALSFKPNKNRGGRA
ncbi:MAG: SDR family NAD(P)-dependent oxidoreductase [Pseudomonadota bacterium]